MSDIPAPPGMTAESVPYHVLLPELETALHQATSENVILRARLRMRDAELEQLRTPKEPLAVSVPTPAAHEETTL